MKAQVKEPITTLGTILIGNEKRDAIHIAVTPVIAANRLMPGQHVGLASADTVYSPDKKPIGPSNVYTVDSSDKPIGVVDPFLKEPVARGQRFWLFLYPNTITALRHEWTHPAFDNDSVKAIERIADKLDITYGALMGAADDWLRFDEPTTQLGSSHWRDSFYDLADDFWHHYSIVTGYIVASEKRESFFSCSC